MEEEGRAIQRKIEQMKERSGARYRERRKSKVERD